MKAKISETQGLCCVSHEGRTGESKKLTLVQKDIWESQNIPERGTGGCKPSAPKKRKRWGRDHADGNLDEPEEWSPGLCPVRRRTRTPGRVVGWRNMRVGWKKPGEQQEYLENSSSLIEKDS